VDDIHWVIFFYKSLHIVINVILFRQDNHTAYRCNRDEDATYHPPSPNETFSQGLVRQARTFSRDMSTCFKIFLPLQTTLIHLIIIWVFIIRLIDVAALGEPVGSRDGLISAMFWSIGVSGFNTGAGDKGDTSNMLLFYALFIVAVFVIVPTVLIELLYQTVAFCYYGTAFHSLSGQAANSAIYAMKFSMQIKYSLRIDVHEDNRPNLCFRIAFDERQCRETLFAH
jgi:hypothetical protein